jgi:ligand-binding sensor domain-containing protein
MLPAGHIGSMIEVEGRGIFAVNGRQLVLIEEDTKVVSIQKNFGSLFAIQVSQGGVMWANSRWGLWQENEGGWAEIVPDIDPHAPLFVSMAFDSTGNLWTGTHAGEIYRFDGQTWIRFAERGELTERPIDGLIVDGFQRPWALSKMTGVFRLDGSDWQRFDIPLFDETEIVDWALDAAGRVAVVTPDTIKVFDDEAGWDVLDGPDTKQVGYYRTILFDTVAGRSYLGTSEGLVLMQGAESRWIGPRDGLRGKDVTSILVDKDRYLWVGFQKDGLSRILLEKLW